MTVANETISPASPPWLLQAPAALQPALSVLWGGIVAAQERVNRALGNLNDTERQFILEQSGPTMRAIRNMSIGRDSAADRELVNATEALAGQVDLDALARSQLALLRTTEEALSLLGDPAPATQCATGPVVFELPDCSVVVGGEGANTYPVDVTLLIDLGGADRYENNAGGADLPDRVAAVLLDLAGNDVYTNNDANAQAVQGAGCFGSGLLADMGGEDAYDVGDRPGCDLNPTSSGSGFKAASQGSGFVGSGVLWDRCTAPSPCDDRYASFDRAQGAASTAGFGLLLDDGGSDSYTIRYRFDSEIAQGAACIASSGALIDRHVGHDVYDAAIDDMQGMACSASLGILLDEDGADTYLLRSGLGSLGGQTVLQSGFGQGYGEVASLGILFDLAGTDAYTVEVLQDLASEGRNAQGAGVLGTGMLLDMGGSDTYTARNQVQGWGAGGGKGILRDGGEPDQYRGNLRCQGSGGDLDAPLLPGEGALLDLGSPGDSYACSEPAFKCDNHDVVVVRGDNKTWCSGDIGSGVDNT